MRLEPKDVFAAESATASSPDDIADRLDEVHELLSKATKIIRESIPDVLLVFCRDDCARDACNLHRDLIVAMDAAEHLAAEMRPF